MSKDLIPWSEQLTSLSRNINSRQSKACWSPVVVHQASHQFSGLSLSFKVVMWWGGVAEGVREGCRSTLPLWEFCLLVHSEQNWGVRKPTLNFSFVTSHENPNFYAAIFYLLCLWATHNEFTNHLENFCAYSCFMELNTLAELMLRAGHSGKRQVEYF